MENGEHQGWYLYCITESNSLDSISGNGLDNKSELLLKQFSNITTVLSLVDLNDFAGAAAEENLNDLGWVGPRALRHEQIIEMVMEESTILPARFGTIFTSLDSLGGFLEKNREQITTFFSDVAHKQEWAVKGYINKKTALELLGEDALIKAQQKLDALSPGMRYFQEKKIKAGVEKEFTRHIQSLLAETHRYLVQNTDHFCELSLLSREASGQELDMVFNWALLLSPDDLDDFEKSVIELNDKENGRLSVR